LIKIIRRKNDERMHEEEKIRIKEERERKNEGRVKKE